MPTMGYGSDLGGLLSGVGSFIGNVHDIRAQKRKEEDQKKKEDAQARRQAMMDKFSMMNAGYQTDENGDLVRTAEWKAKKEEEERDKEYKQNLELFKAGIEPGSAQAQKYFVEKSLAQGQGPIAIPSGGDGLLTSQYSAIPASPQPQATPRFQWSKEEKESKDLERQLKRAQIEKALAEASKERKDATRTGAGIIDPNKVNQNEFRAAGFYSRANEAMKQYDAAISQGFDPTGQNSMLGEFGTQLRRDYSPRALNPKIDNQAIAAQDAFVMATLRPESGASIPPTEIEAQKRIYFPQPGDNEEVIANKAVLRQKALESLKNEGQQALTLGQQRGMLGGSGLLSNTNNKRQVSPSELEQYAKIQRVSLDEAKNFLRGQGYVVN